MGIEAEFLRDNRLIVVHFVGTLDLGEYRQFVQNIHAQLYDQAERPIHSILDLTKSQGLPRNVLSNAYSVSKLKHRNDGLIYFVAGDLLKYRFLEAFVRLTRDPNHFIVKSVDEAHTHIAAALEKEQMGIEVSHAHHESVRRSL